MYLIFTLSNIRENLFFFTVHITLKPHEDVPSLHREIRVSNKVTYNIESENYTTYTTEPAPDFLNTVVGIYLSHKCSPKIIPEVEIVFIPDPKDITRQHYLEQPKSMPCRKLIRKLHGSTSQDFEYNWLPHSFKNL